MNEQIRMLAEQAGMNKMNQRSDGFFVVNEKVFEKFTELIVQECINIVDILPNGYKDYRNAVENAFREDCIKTIEKHFGVE